MESRIAGMYDVLRENFKADPEAASFFYRMNMDEIAHRDVVRFQKRLVRNSRLNFDNVTVTLGNIDTVLGLVASAKMPGISLGEAFGACLEIDRNPAAVYYVTAIAQVSGDLSAMMGNLGGKYVEHYRELEQFIASRGIAVPAGLAQSLMDLGVKPEELKPEPEAVDSMALRPEGTAETPAARKGHILIVEDSLFTRTFLFDILSAAGHHVDIATDGIEAANVLFNTQYPFDLVISDINMPNMDGFKLMEVISQRKMDLPFIILTSRTADEDVVRARNLGAVDYLRKPVKPEVILFSVNSFLYGASRATA